MSLPSRPPTEPKHLAIGLSRRFATYELAVLGFGSLLYVISRFFFRLHIGLILAVLAVTLGYAAWRAKHGGRELLRFWGLRLDNLAASAKVVGPGTFVAALVMLLWALARSGPAVSMTFFLLLPLYPLWGIAQQFLFQSLLHRDLQILTGRRTASCLLTAIAFGLLHSTTTQLAIATFLAGLFWAAAFASCPNIVVLGISHGLLGAMFYYFVAGEDVLRQVVGF